MSNSALLSQCHVIMARVLPFMLLLCGGMALFGTSVAQAQLFQTSAPQAILYDVDSRSTLFERGADELMAPASMVKMVTALVVFEEIAQGRLKLEDEMVVSENAWRRGGAVSGGSTMFALPNSRIKVSDLLSGLLVQSGNDAAIALAEGIAGSEENFVKLMNERSRKIGLTRSVFRNSMGFSNPEQRVTAREMALLADHIIRTYPEFYKFFGQREFTWNRVRQQNRNPLLTMDIGADGLKTGNIDESGYGLVGSAVQNGQRLIVVVNGLKSARERAQEARKLLEWGFRTFEGREVFAAGEVVGEVSVFGGEKSTVAVNTATAVKLLLPRGNSDRVRGRIVFKGPVLAPVAKGAEIGRLQIERGDIKALDVPVFAAEAVESGPLTKRATEAAFELSTGWFRKALSRPAAP
jgi:serine-type D-Ala-D-Ala carboxypeptidase (penicillin-binding protein 5/6)